MKIKNLLGSIESGAIATHIQQTECFSDIVQSLGLKALE